MKSMLFLTDFSEASFRAAEYACGLTSLLGIGRIVLYHAYQTIVPATALPASTVDDNRAIYLESMKALALVQDRLASLTGPGVRIDLLSEDEFFPERINQRCAEEDVELIVMGISGKSGLEKILLGSSTAEILEATEYPLLVVPEEAVPGRPVKNIAFTTDFKDLTTLPVSRLYEYLDAFKANVAVVHIGPVEETHDPAIKEGVTGLHNLLEAYRPVFHYVQDTHVVQGILDFSERNDISLIIAVPGVHHSLAGMLFHKSISQKLAFHSKIPLLALPALEKD